MCRNFGRRWRGLWAHRCTALPRIIPSRTVCVSVFTGRLKQHCVPRSWMVTGWVGCRGSCWVSVLPPRKTSMPRRQSWSSGNRSACRASFYRKVRPPLFPPRVRILRGRFSLRGRFTTVSLGHLCLLILPRLVLFSYGMMLTGRPSSPRMTARLGCWRRGLNVLCWTWVGVRRRSQWTDSSQLIQSLVKPWCRLEFPVGVARRPGPWRRPRTLLVPPLMPLFRTCSLLLALSLLFPFQGCAHVTAGWLGLP